MLGAGCQGGLRLARASSSPPNMLPYLSIFCLSAICIVFAYKSFFNPVLVSFLSSQVPVIAGILWASTTTDIASPYVSVVSLAAVYLFGAFLGALCGLPLIKQLLLKTDSFVAIPIYSRYPKIKSASNYALISNALALLAMLLFSILFVCVDSKWLFSPREAYMRREGIGFIWSYLSFFVASSFVYRLFSERDKHSISQSTHVLSTLWSSGLLLAPYLIASFFTGSKQNTIALILVFFFYSVTFKRVSPLMYLCAFLAVLVCFALLLSISSGFSFGTLDFLSYFDHLSVTSAALELVDKRPMALGDIWISGFWSYVPRALFPDKPLLSGASLFLDSLFPGAVEVGYTPAFLSWLGDYADFGAIGVFTSGFFSFAWVASSYKAFLSRRTSTFLFMVNCGNSFMIFNFPSYLIGISSAFGIALLSRVFFQRRKTLLLSE